MAHPMGISLYMIVKDREKHIAACLKKINPLIDEIIIVDTGSTDATMAAAKKAGAKVYEYKKQDTGDSPRNYAVSLAEYEWILSMEIDEIIAPSDFTAIQELIRNENRDAYSFFLRQYSDDPEQENWFACTDDYTESNGFIGYTQSDEVRLFRNRMNIRYFMHTNELSEDSLKKCPKKHSELPIHVVALDNEERDSREYLSLLLSDYQDDSESYMANLLLGREYCLRGETQNAIKHLLKAVEIREDWWAVYNLGMAYLKSERYAYAIKRLELVRRIMPRYAETHYGLAVAALAMNQYKEAIAGLRRFCQLNPYGVKGINLLGYVYYRQGMYGLAEKVFREALRIHPSYSNAQRNIVRLLNDKGDVKGVETESKRLLEMNPAEQEWVDSLST